MATMAMMDDPQWILHILFQRECGNQLYMRSFLYLCDFRSLGSYIQAPILYSKDFG